MYCGIYITLWVMVFVRPMGIAGVVIEHVLYVYQVCYTSVSTTVKLHQSGNLVQE